VPEVPPGGIDLNLFYANCGHSADEGPFPARNKEKLFRPGKIVSPLATHDRGFSFFSLREVSLSGGRYTGSGTDLFLREGGRSFPDPARSPPDTSSVLNDVPPSIRRRPRKSAMEKFHPGPCSLFPSVTRIPPMLRGDDSPDVG